MGKAMGRTPTAPTRGRLALRGAYDQAASDYTVEQRWEDYSDSEHGIWRTLFTRQRGLLDQYGAPEVAAGLASLGIAPDAIPRFSAVNALLRPATRWRLVAGSGFVFRTPIFAPPPPPQFSRSGW